MSRRCCRTAALLPILVLVMTGCDAGEPAEEREATVDTLANGAVHARSPAEGLWAPGEEWRLVEDLRIGSVDGDGADVFGYVSALAVDDSGRMWAMDGDAAEIRVFDVDGALVRRIGRRGGGPGEFADRDNPTIFGPDGHIWVKDHRNVRWQRFDSAGTLVGSYQPLVRSNRFPPTWGTDGRLREGEYHPIDLRRLAIVVTGVLTEDGSLVPQDTFQIPPLPDFPAMEIRRVENDMVSRFPIPLSHPPERIMGPEGDFWVWDGGGAYRIVRHRLEGDTILILERDYEPVPVPDSVRMAAFPTLDQQFSLNIGPDDIPTRYPPFTRVLLATDGHVWVRRNVSSGMGFDVFDPHGRFLGTVAGGPEYLVTITDRYVYGIMLDELRVNYIVRWRIEKPGMQP